MAQTTIISTPPLSYEDGPAYDVYVDGTHVGRVVRHRHTYRTQFAGKRYGYDRQHWCWWGEMLVGNSHLSDLRCYRTRSEPVAIIERLAQEQDS